MSSIVPVAIRKDRVGRKPAVGKAHQVLAEHRQDDKPSLREDASAAGRVAFEFRMLLALAGWRRC